MAICIYVHTYTNTYYYKLNIYVSSPKIPTVKS